MSRAKPASAPKSVGRRAAGLHHPQRAEHPDEQCGETDEHQAGAPRGVRCGGDGGVVVLAVVPGGVGRVVLVVHELHRAGQPVVAGAVSPALPPVHAAPGSGVCGPWR